MTETPERVERVLVGTAIALAAVMVYELVRRVGFPWDYYIWSESPFLTNLLKLSRGEPLFGDPAQANSYVYSPGLEYVTYAVLRPLSAQLDIRACRIVNVLVGLFAACVAGAAGRHLAVPEGSGRGRATVFVSLVFAVLLFANFTFDVCHPDNLSILHAGLTFLLCGAAAARKGYWLALLAVGVAALGVLAKQSAALTCVGVVAALLACHGRTWGRTKSLGLVAVGVSVLVLSLALLLGRHDARFYVLDLVRDRPLELFRAPGLLRDVVLVPRRAVLVACAPAALLWLVWCDEVRARAYLAAWLGLAAGVLPSLVGYFKTNGVWNNLGVIDYWLALLVVPALWRACRTLFARGAALMGAATTAALLFFLLCCLPHKSTPSPGQIAYGSVLEEHLRADLRAGRRVLLPHGTMPLLRAGLREVPLDRVATTIELDLAGRGALAGTRARIDERYYDRIYMVVPLYAPDVLRAIEQNYHEIERLPGDGGARRGDEYATGFQGLIHDPVRVLERNR